MAGIGVELPFFSRGQGRAQLAQAQLEQAKAVLSRRRRERQAQQAAASVWLKRSRAELQRFDSAVGDRLSQLHRAALASYREGSRGLAELIDAQRTGIAIEERRLSLRWAMQQALLALRAASGELER